MQIKFLSLLVACTLPLAGCKTFGSSPGEGALSTVKGQILPASTCKKAWSTLIPGRKHLYSYEIDSQQTPNGNEGYAGYAARVDRTNCFKDWTILVYMEADNDLSPYAMLDLYEMEAGYKSGKIFSGSTLKSDVVVQLDSAASSEVRRFHMFQHSKPYDESISFEVFKNMHDRDVKSPIVEILPEDDQPSADSLKEFISWGVRQYPSKHYMVVVWGHGQGWTSILPDDQNAIDSSDLLDPADFPGFGGRSGKVADSPKNPYNGRGGGLAFDNNSDSYLDIPGLSSVLNSVVENDLGGKKIDLYASDACLMQMVEVASEIKESTEYIVGSANIQNFMGFPYRRILYELNTNRFLGLKKEYLKSIGKHAEMSCHEPGTGEEPQDNNPCVVDDYEYVEPLVMAQMIPRLQAASLKKTGVSLSARLVPKASETLTMSAMSSHAIAFSLEPALSDLAEALLAYLREDPKLLSSRAKEIRYLFQETPSYDGGAPELGAFVGLMELMLKREEEKGPAMSRARQNLRKEMQATRKVLMMTVMGYAYGSKYKSVETNQYLLGFRAVSLWLPRSVLEYSERIDDFRKSKFYKRMDRSDGSNPWVDVFEEVFNAEDGG